MLVGVVSSVCEFTCLLCLSLLRPLCVSVMPLSPFVSPSLALSRLLLLFPICRLVLPIHPFLCIWCLVLSMSHLQCLFLNRHVRSVCLSLRVSCFILTVSHLMFSVFRLLPAVLSLCLFRPSCVPRVFPFPSSLSCVFMGLAVMHSVLGCLLRSRHVSTHPRHSDGQMTLSKALKFVLKNGFLMEAFQHSSHWWHLVAKVWRAAWISRL